MNNSQNDSIVKDMSALSTGSNERLKSSDPSDIVSIYVLYRIN